MVECDNCGQMFIESTGKVVRSGGPYYDTFCTCPDCLEKNVKERKKKAWAAKVLKTSKEN